MNFNRDETKRPVVLIDIDGVCVIWQSFLPYFLENTKYDIDMTSAIKLLTCESFSLFHDIFYNDRELSKIVVDEYNKTDYIKYLTPYPDALSVINEMKAHWDFVAITAIGYDEKTIENRKYNLNVLFPDAFIDILYCGANESKHKALSIAKSRYDNIIMFIDDATHNIDCAYEVMPDVPRYHIIRDSRLSTDTPRFISRDLNQVKNHYMAQLFQSKNTRLN